MGDPSRRGVAHASRRRIRVSESHVGVASVIAAISVVVAIRDEEVVHAVASFAVSSEGHEGVPAGMSSTTATRCGGGGHCLFALSMFAANELRTELNALSTWIPATSQLSVMSVERDCESLVRDDGHDDSGLSRDDRVRGIDRNRECWAHLQRPLNSHLRSARSSGSAARRQRRGHKPGIA